jgi:hypothetical protein
MLIMIVNDHHAAGGVDPILSAGALVPAFQL